MSYDTYEERRIVEAEIVSIVDVRNRKKKKKSRLSKYVAIACALSIAGGSAAGFGLGYANHPIFVAAQETPPIVATKNAPISPENITFLSSTATMSVANNSVVDVVRNVANSVVSINSISSAHTFYGLIDYESSGSGIIYKEENGVIYIVTNDHVISGAKSVWVSLDDDQQVEASYVGGDEQSDLAVISVKKEDLIAVGSGNYKVATFGDSDSLEVGEMVVAIGNALGEGKTATLGIISAKNKKVSIEGKELRVLQTDAAINPGNSGGALANGSGQVIGINSGKLASTAVEGTGYSIPVSEAKTIIETLMVQGSIPRPYFGVSQGDEITEYIRALNDLPSLGILVRGIVPDSPAALGGLQKYDILVGINDTKIATIDQFNKAITSYKVGDTIQVSVLRNKTTPVTITVTLQNINSKRTSF